MPVYTDQLLFHALHNRKIPQMFRAICDCIVRGQSWRRDITFASDMSIASVGMCIGTNFHSVGPMHRIQQMIYEVPNSRSTAIFSKVLDHEWVCYHPVHTCRNMRHCTRTAWLLAVLNGGALAGLTCGVQFSGRNEPLTRFRPAPVSSKLALSVEIQLLWLQRSEHDTWAFGRTLKGQDNP